MISKMLGRIKGQERVSRDRGASVFSGVSRGFDDIVQPGHIFPITAREGGVLVLTVDGRLEIWRDGQMTSGLKLPGLPEFPKLNHWHAWVDNCLGKKTELRSPFKDAIRMTEATQLAVKATRFPGQELRWDKPTLSFTNHEEATKTIVRRSYRDGFAPPPVV